MFLGYASLRLVSLILSVYRNAFGSYLDAMVQHKPKLRKLCEVHIYLPFVYLKFYFLFWNQLITTWTTKEHLCNNCFLCQAQWFFSYLLSLMNHEQLARNYFNYMNQWRNTRFVIGRASFLAPLRKSINTLQRALVFKRKFSSIITKFKQPWKIQLKWPL